MKKLTNAEIKTLVETIIEPFEAAYIAASQWGEGGDGEADVQINNSDQILFEYEAMYQKPCDATEELLEALRVAFDADHVEKYDDITSGGCESCDYGSSYGFAIRLWDNK